MIDRYLAKEMKVLFSDENKFSTFLDVELAVIEAYVALGVIPKSDYLKIKEKAHIDLSRIAELEEITKHDVIAFTRSISEQLGEEKKWVHYSLTSTDVVDSSWSLLYHQGNEYIKNAYEKLLKAIKEKALLYKYQPIMGRTHGMHAEITSFGLKWVLFYDELNRDLRRFNEESKNLEMIKLSGAVGNYANIPLEVEKFVAQKFHLDSPLIATQVLSRDRHAGYVFSLSAIASTLEKLALEIRHLSRSEIKEVEEGFTKGQKGSSAMPHKRNPIASENICGCARIMKSYVSVALENNLLWHERDISHSSAERIMFPDAISLIYYMIQRMTKIIENLVVYPEQMEHNIHLTYDVIFSGNVLQKLIQKGLSREKGYDLIQPLTFLALERKVSFEKILNESQEVLLYLTKEEIHACFDVSYYLKHVDDIYQRLEW